MNRGWTRRRVLRAAVFGTAAIAGCAAHGPSIWSRRPGRLRLVFFTDAHARAEEPIRRALESAASAIRTQHPDLVLAGGDLVDAGVGVTAEQAAPMWEAYGALSAGVGAELHHVLGNHDVSGSIPAILAGRLDPRAMARERLGLVRSYGSFDAAGYHVVLLDSIDLYGRTLEYRGFVAGEQLDWLRGDLARTPREQPVVAVSHMPLWTGYFGQPDRPGGGPSDRVVGNAREVLDILETRPLAAVLQGHLHVAEALRRRGTLFLTGGAICGRWWKGDHHGTPPGFAVVELSAGRARWSYVSYVGAALAAAVPPSAEPRFFTSETHARE